MGRSANPPDLMAQVQRMQEQIRQLRMKRTPSGARGRWEFVTFSMPGTITTARKFTPALISLNPILNGKHPESKKIVAFDAWLGGAFGTEKLTVDWTANRNLISVLFPHSIGDGDNNRVILATPYVITDAAVINGFFLEPQIASVPANPVVDLSCIAIIESLPV